jgi:hypothetical protein
MGSPKRGGVQAVGKVRRGYESRGIELYVQDYEIGCTVDCSFMPRRLTNLTNSYKNGYRILYSFHGCVLARELFLTKAIAYCLVRSSVR